MISRTLKSSMLSVSYEVMLGESKTSKRKQNLTFASRTSTDDDKYAIASLVGKILVSNPLSVENTEVYLLSEE